MGRPKTTGKSHNHNASTYTSKSVIKNKKDNTQKTVLNFLRGDQLSTSLLTFNEGTF